MSNEAYLSGGDDGEESGSGELHFEGVVGFLVGIKVGWFSV